MLIGAVGVLKAVFGKDLVVSGILKVKILRRGGKNTQKNCTKKIFMTQIITMV